MSLSIILGSQSPRRKEILNYFSLPFIQVSPPFDEESIKFSGDPKEYVITVAKGKAKALADLYPDSLILTADTIVYREGTIYGKPSNESEAFRYLSELVGHWHSVFTAVTLSRGHNLIHGFEETKVLFNALTDNEIKNYQRNTNWQDKAGGYAIQMPGGLLVKRIDGCYYNVMGLPMNTVKKLLSEFGVDLWDYLQGTSI